MTKDQIFSSEKSGKDFNENDYASAVTHLLDEQKVSWPMAESGYGSLKSVETKKFDFGGFQFNVQFNPGRITSSSAKVDDKSIKERKCFLCAANLPREQKAIPYGSDYLILVNPFPIFPEHLTLTNREHIPQRIKNSIGSLLDLSKDLGKNFTVFYNGPRCGASAPDHLHFQAGTKSFMPIEKNYDQLKTKHGEPLSETDDYKIFAVSDGIRKFLSFESGDKNVLIKLFEKLYEIYDPHSPDGEEPMMNIISVYDEIGWKILIFLREKHRPSHYFEEGEKNILLSPASVDLGGLCITPLEKDFNKITKEDIREIMSEVSLNEETFEDLKKKLKNL